MKRRLDDLAMFGGPPAFDADLHVGQPNVGDEARLLERMRDLLDRRWFTNNGRYVQEFERCIADTLGVAHCVAVCNATIGLEIAIRALGLRGEVIVPSFTFVATAHALQWQEITPVFCDIDPATHTLDPARVEALVTPRTTGIIGVHLWGRTCDVDALAEVARRRGLTLLYDAAHAFGCTNKGRMVGSFGAAEVLSFHATKFLNSFEGGAIVTNDAAVAKRASLMRNFGFAELDRVVSIGTNGKMTEIAAAMGLTSLESMDRFIEVNRRNHARYADLLAGLPGIALLPYDPAERSNYQYVVLDIETGAAGIGRDALLKALMAERVRARRYFYPGCHRMEPYRTLYPNAGAHLPETERCAERLLQLPNGTGVSPDAVARICQILRFLVGNAAAIGERLRGAAA